MWHLSAPRSAVFARDCGLSAKAGLEDAVRRFPEWAWPFDIRTARLGDTTEGVATSRPVSVPADDADASASSASLCAAQAHPARRSGHETAGSVRHPAVSPVSPEGDHFPQAPVAKDHVLPAPQAPTPPRCHAWQCIRGRDGESVGTGSGGGENGDENGRRSGLAGVEKSSGRARGCRRLRECRGGAKVILTNNVHRGARASSPAFPLRRGRSRGSW
jgi:hypothetical protein